MSRSNPGRVLLLAWLLWGPSAATATNVFTVAFYNLENWLALPAEDGTLAPKPALARTAAAAVIASIRADVLAVAEIGGPADLQDLQQHLRPHQLEYPHREWVAAADSVRRLALLSRFPISQRQSLTNATFQWHDQSWPLLRGLLDVRVHPTPNYSFRALVVHLKSRRPVTEADQAALRLGEARLVREHLERILATTPEENLLLMGDFNDLPESPTLQTIVGRAPPQLLLLHPRDARGYDTTHFWRGKRQWSRIDYLALAPGLANEYLAHSAQIAAPENTLVASDHRAIHASFIADDAPRSPAASSPAAPRSIAPRTWVLLGIVVLLLVALIARRGQRPPPRSPS